MKQTHFLLFKVCKIGFLQHFHSTLKWCLLLNKIVFQNLRSRAIQTIFLISFLIILLTKANTDKQGPTHEEQTSCFLSQLSWTDHAKIQALEIQQEQT